LGREPVSKSGRKERITEVNIIEAHSETHQKLFKRRGEEGRMVKKE
jgi:hypothetical protein